MAGYTGAIAQLSVVGAKAKVVPALRLGRNNRHAPPVRRDSAAFGSRNGWLALDNFSGIAIRPSPLRQRAFIALPGGNPSAYGTTSPAKFLDGAGSNTKLGTLHL